ncbi:MAG: GNAT family N-acetyltransferase, partial [Bacteroidota bacterium]
MKVPLSLVLETERFKLRAPKLADVPFIFSATRHEGFNDGMPWGPPDSIDELLPNVQKALDVWEANTAFSFTIVEKQEDDLIGRISIRSTKETNRWNVGFFTHPLQQKKGVMSEVLAEVVQFGFTSLNAQVIEALYAIWNVGSERVLHKNGFKFVEFIEEGFRKNGIWVHEHK